MSETIDKPPCFRRIDIGLKYSQSHAKKYRQAFAGGINVVRYPYRYRWKSYKYFS